MPLHFLRIIRTTGNRGLYCVLIPVIHHMPSPASLHACIWKSPIGNMKIVVSDKGIRELKITNTKVDQKGEHPLLKKVIKQLEEYFAGKRTAFDLPLDTDGTDFQKRVWKSLGKIPSGKTKSYAEIARMIGSPKAARAVGNALNKNPVCVIVPCHRVLASGGKIGGYAFGITAKKKLLGLESAE